MLLRGEIYFVGCFVGGIILECVGVSEVLGVEAGGGFGGGIVGGGV